MGPLDIVAGQTRTYEHRGRFRVTMHVPPGSTLDQGEIGRILSASSWEASPSDITDGYEGGRGILLKRSRETRYNGMNLGALQINGIGYKRITANGGHIAHMKKNAPFEPPTSENFIGTMPEGTMTTAHAEGNRRLDSRPAYRAMGAYTHEELSTTVINTMRAQKLQLSRLKTPLVEAYGFFNEQSLSNEGGPFGFVVYSVPFVGRRLGAHYLDLISTVQGVVEKTPQMLSMYYKEVYPFIISFVEGLRELHDHGLVHHQPHLGNVYDVDGVPFLMDWHTSRKLRGMREEDALNKAIDVEGVIESLGKITAYLFPAEAPPMEPVEINIVLDAYFGNFNREGALQEETIRRASASFKRPAAELGPIDVIAQMILDETRVSA